jgi:hypothetical protein
MKLPLPLAELGLIDEYEFVGAAQASGPWADVVRGLSKRIDLKLVNRLESARGRWRCGMSRGDNHPLLSPSRPPPILSDI